MRLLLVPFVLVASACHSSAPEDPVALGDETFASVCARCHGQDGKGGAPAADGSRPRDLTDPAWQSSVGDGQIEATIVAGRPPMPGFGKALTSEQVQALVAKIRRMRLRLRLPMNKETRP